ncbi:MAG: gamma-glutamyltransferase [Rhodospirillaceae bacterium]|nr:gamma-glutamyltransferase [Rhodospirillaceae bacterium]
MTSSTSKRAVASPRGVVAAQHPAAAEAGIRMLASGGNAIDAAVAATLAVGVVEPWLSGIGGGGLMLLRLAAEGVTRGIDFSMVSPRRLDPARYALATGTDAGLFQWPRVVGDRNISGPESICVPGTIAGLGLATERFARLSWRQLIQPAIELAEAGLPVDWFTALTIGVEAGLEAYPATRMVFLPGGAAPKADTGLRLANPALTGTLRRLADAGPGDFYEGGIARGIVADLAAHGSVIDRDDLAGYEARMVEPASLDYRGTAIEAMPGLTGGPTYLAAMRGLLHDIVPGTSPTPEAFVAYARALTAAYADRFATHGHAGLTHDSGCTSHVSVIDADGNMASVTNTLLARFGAKLVLPSTGILMNNGMMWFDPRPGAANAIAAGKRPLANMCPLLATRNGTPVFVMGAAGGRQIVPALVQLTSLLLDFGMSVDEALRVPRLDASTSTVICDDRMPAGQVAAIAQSFPVSRIADTVYPVQFGVPNAVVRERGLNIGMAHPTTPWPVALAES